MFTKEFDLPSVEELTVPEINLSTSRLYAGAQHLGKYCEKPEQEFVLCSKENRDPRACITEGKTLTACGIDFFKEVKASCLEEFEQFATCVDKSSPDHDPYLCKKTQTVFDQCMLDKLKLRRPSYGYFCRPKILDTDRPKPRGYVSPDFPDAPKPVVVPGDLSAYDHVSGMP